MHILIVSGTGQIVWEMHMLIVSGTGQNVWAIIWTIIVYNRLQAVT